MNLEEFEWRCASSISPSAIWAFLFNFLSPVGQCVQGSSRKMWVSSRAILAAIEIFLFTFLDWPYFHLADYWFLFWMPFKKLWDMYSNYFFHADDGAKGFRSSISSAAKRGQNRNVTLLSIWMLCWIRRCCETKLWKRCHCLLATSSFRIRIF